MTRSRRMVVLVVAIATAVATFAAPASAEATRTYKVTVTNLTGGQPMTPFVVATHDNQFKLFKNGRSASFGLQQVAENGAVPILVAEVSASAGVNDVGVAGAAPIAPGGTESVYVDATSSAKRFSLAGMLICTNDGFAGLNSLRLPTDGSRTFYARAWDAGTEINTESYSDLVPPCDGLGQTGETNPALAENGYVHPHLGIQGIADLDPAVHGWTGRVLMVTVERVS